MNTQIMTKELLLKYLNNQCSDAELNQVMHWAKTEALNHESWNWAHYDWETYSAEEAPVSDEMLSSLFDKIHREIENEPAGSNDTKQSISFVHRCVNGFSKAAAILFIPVLAVLFYMLADRQAFQSSFVEQSTDSLEVIAPIGSRTTVYLSDGSVVDLNYGSTLKYPQTFSGQIREVRLSGEGFFKVAHNPEKPFIVKTNDLNVKAVGTSFNVSAYSGAKNIATTLVDGKVILSANTKNGTVKTLGAMLPGQHVKYNNLSCTTSCTTGNIEKYIAWKDGKLVFEDASIEEVAEKLSRMFNVQIDVNDEIKDYTYTVTFVDEPLFQILDLMTIATPVRYTAFPRTKRPDGTFSKQKIVISKKR